MGCTNLDLGLIAYDVLEHPVLQPLHVVLHDSALPVLKGLGSKLAGDMLELVHIHLRTQTMSMEA